MNSISLFINSGLMRKIFHKTWKDRWKIEVNDILVKMTICQVFYCRS